MADVNAICVFCGSSQGSRPEYAEAAKTVGRLIAEKGVTLIYGGGAVGMMGAVADAVIQHGGTTVGVIPQALAEKEVAHQGLTELLVVDSMHQRKALMAERADAFVALPGGFGTFEELCEIITWYQLGIHRKPYGVLNVNGYFDALLRQFDHAVAEGFIRQEHRQVVLSFDDPTELLETMLTVRPPELRQWIGKSET